MNSAIISQYYAAIVRIDRIKGKVRDWFDFEWYVRNNAVLDFNHYKERVRCLSPQEPAIESTEAFKTSFRNKIASVDYKLAKKDVAPFIEDQGVLEIWSAEYFNELIDLIRFQ